MYIYENRYDEIFSGSSNRVYHKSLKFNRAHFFILIHLTVYLLRDAMLDQAVVIVLYYSIISRMFLAFFLHCDKVCLLKFIETK